MKRAVPWRDEGDDDKDGISSDSDDEYSSGTSSEENKGFAKKDTTNSSGSSKWKTSQVESAKQKGRGINFEALTRHGYKGGLSVLSVPPPKETNEHKQDWSWSRGQETRQKETEETYEERKRTRAAIIEGEQLVNVQTQKEKKNLSYSQREKKKRDLGQASRGKNYVEEEKRLLRDNGVYSGFDS